MAERLTFLTWNILHGGGPLRLAEIVLAIVERCADVVVLTEFRATRGAGLRGVLADHGLVHQGVTPNGEGNGILIASRVPMAVEEAPLLTPWGRGRWLGAELAGPGISLLAVHVPDDTMRGRKAGFWQDIVAWGRRHRDRRAMVLGDMNTGRRWHDVGPAPSGCEALLGTLLSLGYTDAWRSLNGASREVSWTRPGGSSHAAAAGGGAGGAAEPGMRIDAAYVSEALRGSLESAWLSHEERRRGLSDHSPLIVTLTLDGWHAGGAGARSGGLFGR